MGFRISLIALIIGIGFLAFVLRAIKKNSLRPSYAALWIFISFFLVSIPVAEPLYRWFSRSILGLIDTRHIIYIVLIGFLLIYVFYLTIKVNLMNDQIQQLISRVAIQDNEIKALMSNDDHNGDS